jgi:hypothetical protein
MSFLNKTKAENLGPANRSFFLLHDGKTAESGCGIRFNPAILDKKSLGKWDWSVSCRFNFMVLCTKTSLAKLNDSKTKDYRFEDYPILESFNLRIFESNLWR